MKRGQIQTEVLIAIIIGVLVLSLVIYGISTEWDMFNKDICGNIGCADNTESIQNACELACLDKDKVEYCEKIRTIKFNQTSKKGTCEKLSEEKQFEIKSCIGIC